MTAVDAFQSYVAGVSSSLDESDTAGVAVTVKDFYHSWRIQANAITNCFPSFFSFHFS
jgi:hypothetical protein